MDYAILAIMLWIIFTVVLVIVSRRSMFKQFGKSQKTILWGGWRIYLFCMMILGAALSFGITFLVKSIS
jgi:hypothetical protein